MGRKIRMVPKDWEHPKDESGNYKPIYDESYKEASEKWVRELVAWENGTHEDLRSDPTMKEGTPFFWEWTGPPPEEEYYRPAFDSEPDHFQIYETVSAGTPFSPVFSNKDDMKRWLINEGYSLKAAQGFCDSGYAPSGIMTNGKFYQGIHSCDLDD